MLHDKCPAARGEAFVVNTPDSLKLTVNNKSFNNFYTIMTGIPASLGIPRGTLRVETQQVSPEMSPAVGRISRFLMHQMNPSLGDHAVNQFVMRLKG